MLQILFGLNKFSLKLFDLFAIMFCDFSLIWVILIILIGILSLISVFLACFQICLNVCDLQIKISDEQLKEIEIVL